MTHPAIQELTRNAAERLPFAPDPMREARKLLSIALGLPQWRLADLKADRLTDDVMEKFAKIVDKRAARVPMSHIEGERQFWSHSFIVTPDVLDPRPETEALVEEALDKPFTRVLDLGTGSGCILLTLIAERDDATGVGVDLSQDALTVAEENADVLGVADRVTFHQGSWLEPVNGSFDLIVSNPPYIPAEDMADLEPELGYEPRMALTDENDGLSAYRAICAHAGAYLAPGGRLLMEFGIDQWPDVAAIAEIAGWADVSCRNDLDGRPRVLVAKSPLLMRD